MSNFPYLQANIEALQKMNHPIYYWLSEAKLDADKLNARLFKNKWGLLDWLMDTGQGMFESLPPSPLYKDWIPAEKDKVHTSATIIVGANLGYGINHVLANTPQSHKVLILEPNPYLLAACLGQTDYRPFFENRKLHLLPPNETYLNEVIKNLDLQYLYGHIYLRGDMASGQMGKEYAQWITHCRHRLENFSVEMLTLRHRQDTMVGNELHNFQRSLSEGSLRQLKDSANGLGAVILGAGPSLAQFAPELAENRGNALYCTALQTMPALQKHGLKPDMCMAIDYAEGMLKIYDSLDEEFARDVPFIYSTKVDPRVVERYPGPTIPMWTLGGLGTFAMRDHELVLDAGGNVSLTMTRFMNYCGVSHMLLVGQDFAWQGESSHANGHHAARRKVTFRPGVHQKLTNREGETIYSTMQYTTSRRELENDIVKLDIPVFNLYGGGCDIRGTRVVDMKSVRMDGLLASEPGARRRYMEHLEQARTVRRTFNFEPRSPKWSASLRNAEKKAEKLFKHLDRNQQEVHRLMEQTLLFLRQDPLYLPYLFNESMNMAGLAKARHHYTRKDLSEFKSIIKKALTKVREMDRNLMPAENGTAKSGHQAA